MCQSELRATCPPLTTPIGESIAATAIHSKQTLQRIELTLKGIVLFPFPGLMETKPGHITLELDGNPVSIYTYHRIVLECTSAAVVGNADIVIWT